jgi:replicative DNA helicase
MSRLNGHNEPIDQLTLCDQLKQDGHLETVGGAGSLAELWAELSSTANVVHHCQIIRECWHRRQLGHIGHELVRKAYDKQEPFADLVETAQSQVFSLTNGRSDQQDVSIADLLPPRLAHLDSLYKKGSAVTGIPTGFPTLDAMTAGLQAGNLIVIAGRPSMGKTSLALRIAWHVAAGHDLPVLIFSLEMSKEEVTDRFLSMAATVDAHVLRTGRIKPEDWSRLAATSQQLAQAPLFIDDSGSLTMALLRSRARRRKARSGLAMVVIDYLQLLSSGQRGESRQQEIADISRSLKLLSKELAVPILVLSQLNRSVENRDDKQPTLADLRDSGAIEQDADLVMMVYRDEVYKHESPKKGIADILIRKHRNGPTGNRELVFLERYCRFEDLEP